MAIVYHVNAETGRANICRAETPEKCPLRSEDGTGAFHSEDKETARKHGLAILEKEHGSHGTILKKNSTKNVSDKTQTAADEPVLTKEEIKELEKEVIDLRDSKTKTDDPTERSRIAAAIRGKKLHIDAAKKALREARRAKAEEAAKAPKKPRASKTTVKKEEKALSDIGQKQNSATGPVQRPRVEDIPYSTIRVMKKTQKPADLPKVVVEQEPVEPVAAQILDKSINLNDKKEMLKNHLSDKENYNKVKAIFEENGYSIENSNVINGLMSGDAGSNIVYRSAIRESELSGDTRVADILMRIEDADFESDTIALSDRFTAYDPDAATKTSEDDFDDEEGDLEDAPEFLKDDPDFIIEDEDIDEDEEI